MGARGYGFAAGSSFGLTGCVKLGHTELLPADRRPKLRWVGAGAVRRGAGTRPDRDPAAALRSLPPASAPRAGRLSVSWGTPPRAGFWRAMWGRTWRSC